ncbi:MAG: acetyl-CoA C-acetyltransferase [Bacillota bacterium]|nr:MAG: acetyl-CoA C-acetyltransferase [Bacillota bacterium]
MRETVIVGAARTPFGKLGGALKDVPAVELGAVAIRAALERAGIRGDQVDYVLMGMVVQAGAGQIPSRQAAARAGIPMTVPSDTINKVCASSLRAVNLADALIRAGDADVVVAGGMESMSQAPYLARHARFGRRLGHAELEDALLTDGLLCAFGGCHMGVYGSRVAKEYGVTREEQDRWALRSHQRAIAAIDSGKLAEEIVPVEVPRGKGGTVRVEVDESPRRDTSYEKLAALPPVFEPDGTVTAGNAPGINDGAAALVLMAREKAEALGIRPLATIVSQGQASWDPPYLHTVPYYAAKKALEKRGMTWSDIDLFEVNEAFAAVALTSMKLGDWDPEKVNVNGGAVALGHPIGASGARILMTLAFELRRRGGGYGVATICSGGGQGEATLIRVDA